jgi:GNAT superfamily N-acetyltransferase
MQIDYLAQHPEFIPELARWHHQEWAHLRPGDSIEARISRLRAACGRAEIPTVVVAFTDATLLGSAKLVLHDMDTHMDLSPWLAGVFVSPEHRSQGIGTALVQRAVSEARSLGVQRLHLYTPGAEQFYLRLGWSPVERLTYRGAEVVVMSYSYATR